MGDGHVAGLSGERAKDGGDPRALAAAVGRLLDGRGLALRLATAASEAAKRYTWTERALRLREFLRSLP
jgi:glycosyltransferase involved in cell wall biosynthesis